MNLGGGAKPAFNTLGLLGSSSGGLLGLGNGQGSQAMSVGGGTGLIGHNSQLLGPKPKNEMGGISTFGSGGGLLGSSTSNGGLLGGFSSSGGLLGGVRNNGSQAGLAKSSVQNQGVFPGNGRLLGQTSSAGIGLLGGGTGLGSGSLLLGPQTKNSWTANTNPLQSMPRKNKLGNIHAMVAQDTFKGTSIGELRAADYNGIQGLQAPADVNQKFQNYKSQCGVGANMSGGQLGFNGMGQTGLGGSNGALGGWHGSTMSLSTSSEVHGNLPSTLMPGSTNGGGLLGNSLGLLSGFGTHGLLESGLNPSQTTQSKNSLGGSQLGPQLSLQLQGSALGTTENNSGHFGSGLGPFGATSSCQNIQTDQPIPMPVATSNISRSILSTTTDSTMPNQVQFAHSSPSQVQTTSGNFICPLSPESNQLFQFQPVLTPEGSFVFIPAGAPFEFIQRIFGKSQQHEEPEPEERIDEIRISISSLIMSHEEKQVELEKERMYLKYKERQEQAKREIYLKNDLMKKRNNDFLQLRTLPKTPQVIRIQENRLGISKKRQKNGSFAMSRKEMEIFSSKSSKETNMSFSDKKSVPNSKKSGMSSSISSILPIIDDQTVLKLFIEVESKGDSVLLEMVPVQVLGRRTIRQVKHAFLVNFVKSCPEFKNYVTIDPKSCTLIKEDSSVLENDDDLIKVHVDGAKTFLKAELAEEVWEKMSKENNETEIPRIPEGYETTPSYAELCQMSEKQLRSVKDFSIQNEFGEIHFPGETDIYGLDLEKIVKIEHLSIDVYSDSELPPVGIGLNKPAVLSFYFVLKNPKKQSKAKNQERMEKWAKAQKAELVEWNQDLNTFSIRVKNFQRDDRLQKG